jgi:hypothetical protein
MDGMSWSGPPTRMPLSAEIPALVSTTISPRPSQTEDSQAVASCKVWRFGELGTVILSESCIDVGEVVEETSWPLVSVPLDFGRPRTYLNILRSRDGDGFPPGLGATTAVYLTYTSGVATTSWTKSVPSHLMNEYPSWVAARTVGEKTSCLGRRSGFDLRHDVFPPSRRSDNAAHGGY